MTARFDETSEFTLPQGTIRYRDVGEGPTLVFVHGLLVSGTLWRKVVERLAGRFRCVVPDWPLGSHPIPMRADADLSPAGCARLVADFLDALGLDDVTLVGNDTGGAICQLVAARHNTRVSRLVLTTCDAFEVFPPPLFAYLRYVTYVPGVLAAVGRAMLAVPPLRRLPVAYGLVSHRPIDQDVLRAWITPGTRDPAIRRDLAKVIRGAAPEVTLEVARELPRFTRPVLLAWSPENRFFPMELAHRLARAFPDARVVSIPDAGLFSAEDNPDAVARAIADFMSERRADAATAREP